MGLVRGPGGGLLRLANGSLAKDSSCCCDGTAATCCERLPVTITGRMTSETCPALDDITLTLHRRLNTYAGGDPGSCPASSVWEWHGEATICGYTWQFTMWCCNSVGGLNPGSRCGDYWLAIVGPDCVGGVGGWLEPTQADNVSDDECLSCCGQWWEYGGFFDDCECCHEESGTFHNFFVYLNECA